MASSLRFSQSSLRKIEGSGGVEKESWNLAGESAGVTEPGKTRCTLVPPHPCASTSVHPHTCRSGSGRSLKVCFRALTCYPTSKCREWGYKPHVVVEPQGPWPAELRGSQPLLAPLPKAASLSKALAKWGMDGEGIVGEAYFLIHSCACAGVGRV